MSAGTVYRRIAAAERADGADGQARKYDELAAQADTARADDAGDAQLRDALHSEVGAAKRRADAARARGDADAERRELAVKDRAIADVGALGVRNDSVAPPRIDATPTGDELRNAHGAVRWRTDLDDKQRDELAKTRAREVAERRVAHARRPRLDAVNATVRTDMGKLEAEIDDVKKIADLVQKKVGAFEQLGDTARAVRLKAIASELATFAEPPASSQRGDATRDARRDAWRATLPNAEHRGSR